VAVEKLARIDSAKKSTRQDALVERWPRARCL